MTTTQPKNTTTNTENNAFVEAIHYQTISGQSQYWLRITKGNKEPITVKIGDRNFNKLQQLLTNNL